jgi:hypothetical protein
MDPDIVIFASGLEDKDRIIYILGEPVSKNAASASCPYDNIVKFSEVLRHYTYFDSHILPPKACLKSSILLSGT